MAKNKKTLTTVITFCRFLSEYKENLNDSVQVFSRTPIALVMENGRVVQDFIRIPNWRFQLSPQWFSWRTLTAVC